MRLVLLGLGRIGAFHAETLTHLPAVEELVVSDPVLSLTQEIAERTGAKAATSPEEVLASGVDRPATSAGCTRPVHHAGSAPAATDLSRRVRRDLPRLQRA
jgi:hypothetical protein